jgi:hypothetical protein
VPAGRPLQADVLIVSKMDVDTNLLMDFDRRNVIVAAIMLRMSCTVLYEAIVLVAIFDMMT